MIIILTMLNRFCLIFLFFTGVVVVTAQVKKGPAAKFSFNDDKDYDEVSGIKIKAVGVNYTRDRFGNRNSAVYFYGNAFSYINLGAYKALKPKRGTVSLWVKIDSPIWSGKGRNMNPFIITKRCGEDDFYESYSVHYFTETKKVSVICTQDSTNQLAISSLENFSLRQWHHLALTYDNRYLCFYIDGNLEKSMPKNFETGFLESDSVVVGSTANKKNLRFLEGCVDDIEIYDRVLSPGEIYGLYTAPNPDKNQVVLNWVLIGLAAVIFIILVFVFIRYRVKVALKKEKQQMELTNRSLENELRVHRALMNPHFIFNSLNGLQNFILTNATEAANDYLVKFSKLIRKILESNMSDTITLELEIELLERYLEIEDLRFEENILHTITVAPGITPSATIIPIMMLQPFVENAIWHGLLNKEGAKRLDISFELYREKYVCCVIEDNGVGRENTGSEDTGKRSLATLFIRQRLELLNRIHGLECSLAIEDKPGNGGTLVRITLPILDGQDHAAARHNY